MRNYKEILKRVAAAMMAFMMMFTLVGCGAKTLEDIVKEDTNVKEQIESMAVGGLEVAVKDNQIIYTYTYDQTFEKEALKAVKPEIEKIMTSTDSIYENMVEQVESATKLDDVSIKIVYNNGDGNTIYENSYE